MNYLFLANTMLFRGIAVEDVKGILDCLGSFTKKYEKGDTVFRAGDTAESIGLVVTGSVNIESDDVWGNKSIFGRAGVGELFAESYACIPGEQMMVSVVACEKTEVMFINASRLLIPCSNSCLHHNRLIKNLLQVTTQKNLGLSRRILHTSSKTIRGRLLSYLSEHARQHGSYAFTIPFNRQQLADYLSVDRSAMSNELSKMQKDGIIDYEKNSFIIHQI
ncbi:MAG: Crp/Fnr family transcriptional regulator [Clostridiales bacterium]|nr:Crp/Fnr family transcriptional regulator [Clostridiales bacterium]